jgi:ABC-type transport system substrate-binding protein
VTGAEEWEGMGLDWYFDNLDDDDRRKIRQAMDYLIPRAQIIDGLHQGLAIPLATDVGQNVMGYDDSIQPREYNTTLAAALLTEVFGKTYNIDAEEDSTTETSVPYFSMVLVSPTTNVARTQWASMISFAFANAGIDVELKWWNWNIIMPRIYLDPVGVGYNYEHGGVDAWFVGQNANPDPDYSTGYWESQFAPAGDNAAWIESAEVTDILNRSLTETTLTDRLTALEEFQEWFYEEVPKSIIRQGMDLFPMDEDIEGFDSYLTGRGWNFNNITIVHPAPTGAQTTMTYTVPGDFIDFNPIMSNSYYDFVPIANVMGALTQRRGDYNLSHPVPQLAESWTSTPDGLTWEVKLRPDVLWDDGTAVTADDVLFTYHSVLEDATQNPQQGFFLDRFPNNASDIYLKEGTTDTIVFELGSIYPYVTTQVFGLSILQKAQWESVGLANWKTSTLNTGTGSEFIKGFGPYKMTAYSVSDGVTLVPNTHYDEAVFDHDPDAVGGGIFMTNPTIAEIHVVVVKEATTAIAGLASGIYDILDSQTGVQAQYEDLSEPDNEYNSKVITALEYGWQELSYNHYDPRWGMNAHDPREMYPDDYNGSAPLDPLGIFLGIIALAGYQILRKRKRN